MTSFSDLGLAEPILRAVTDEGYTSPTPIQAKAIPAMLSGKDVVGIAQTGTGKTAAFVLPILHRITRSNKRPQPKCCRALIVTPTRELAAQIADNVTTYGKHMHHSVAVVIGGARPNPQIRAMSRGVDILVATPGRLLDHMSTGAIRLDQTHTVILDEADQMLDLGFMPAIRRIMSNLPDERQTLLFSATMPKQIRSLASDFLDAPQEISVAPASKPIDRIKQKVIYVKKPAKRELLVQILKDDPVERAIVFTRTKRGADVVCKRLVNSGMDAVAIHGNKSQNQRKRALAAFKKGDMNILVATDIAARGIDVDGVSHVFNFELPNIPEAYVHRIGRTARAGKDGIAISFCDAEERGLLTDIEKLIGIKIEKEGTAPEDVPPALDPQQKNKRRNRNKQGGGKPGGGKPRPHGGRPGQNRRRKKKPAKPNT